MSFESFIAYRHLVRKKRSKFVSIVSVLTVLGIAIGVAVLIVVLAVMRGFDRDYKSIFVNVQPHLRIDRIDGIDNAESEIAKMKERLPGLKSAARFVEGQGMLQFGGAAVGVAVKGMDVKNEDLSIYTERMRLGEMDFSDSVQTDKKRKLIVFSKSEEQVIGSMIVGEGVAYRLNARIGDRVNLVVPAKQEEKKLSFGFAENYPFVIKGVFSVGLSDFDSQLVLISLEQSQKIYHLGNKVQGMSLRFDNVDDAPAMKEVLRGNYGSSYYFRTWHDLNAVFFQALEVERSLMHILLAFIILVAGFNITSILILVVTEKTKDIGILRAIGATRGSIRKIFMIEGFTTGFIGVVIGTVTGLLVIEYRTPIREILKKYFSLDIFPSDVYFLKVIPAEVNLHDVTVIVGFAILSSILAGFYPAHRAASKDPIEALHYE